MSQTLFNDSWFFNEFPSGTDYPEMVNSTDLKPVDVPHDWMIWHVNDLYKDSIGFYKKSFLITAAKDHTYIIRFEGIYMNSEIYLNGTRIFEWKYGYSTFEVDLTDHLKDGENLLCVKVNYEAPNTRWYSGAGIYRNVYFIDKEKAYLPTDGTYLSTEVKKDGFSLTIESELKATVPGSYMLRHTVLDMDGNAVCVSEGPVSPEKTASDLRTVFIKDPHRWDIDDPYVYSVVSDVIEDGCVLDSIKNPLGFRTIEFDCNKGFFLNGRNVKINGACQHHDLGCLGAAMNKTALKRQLSMLKEMGVNSVRTSHNMPAKELMELADEMGILIMSESFDMWELPKTAHDYGVFFPEWWQRDVDSWVRRDRNHPSLIIWSIGNEIYDTHRGTGLKWAVLLRDEVRRLDRFRNAYIGIGSNYMEWENAQKCSAELDLAGYNYGERLYDKHHEQYPDWCMFGSETASTVQSRGIYHFPLDVRLLTHEDGQCSCLGNCSTNWGAKNVDVVVSAHRDRDYIFGQYIWTGWDYIGEPTPYFSKNSYFGQIDTAGFKKDTFYHYQAEWTSMDTSPMVHLLPYWDFNEGQIIDVIAYSNAPGVELFFNGISLGKQYIDHEHGLDLKGHWTLPYSKGELVVRAYDALGNVIATDSTRSFTDPVALTAVPDKTALTADGEDLCFIEISSVDKDGTFVANGRSRINVTVSGPGRLVGLDNGDSTDYEEYKGSSRRLFSGKLLAVIAATDKSGEIIVDLSSPGLESTVVKIQATENKTGRVIPCRDMCFDTAPGTDIPVRKINLINRGTGSLNENNRSCEVEYEILPSNATCSDIGFKALTKDGVEANFAEISVNGNKVKVDALGDGFFKLFAFANNGKDHPEVISELDFTVTGLGLATRDPYKPVPGCEYSDTHVGKAQISFEGGIFLPESDNAFVSFKNLDFGDFGSDEVNVPIFTFDDELPIEIWEGTPDTGECLLKDVYRAKSIYNHYQANTFKLSRRVKGLTELTFVFRSKSRFSFKGFTFTEPEKAYSLIKAGECSAITGDDFTRNEDSVTGIGNNVAIEFSDMDFTRGLSAVEITGRSNNPQCTIHILFPDESRQIVELSYSEDYKKITLPLENNNSSGKVTFMFLPGSNFDLKEFRFICS